MKTPNTQQPTEPKEISLYHTLVGDESVIEVGAFEKDKLPVVESDEEIAANAQALLTEDTSIDRRAAILQYAFVLLQSWIEAAMKTDNQHERAALLCKAERFTSTYMLEIFRHTTEGRNALNVALAVQTGRQIKFRYHRDTTTQGGIVGHFVESRQAFICEAVE